MGCMLHHPRPVLAVATISEHIEPVRNEVRDRTRMTGETFVVLEIAPTDIAYRLGMRYSLCAEVDLPRYLARGAKVVA